MAIDEVLVEVQWGASHPPPGSSSFNSDLESFVGNFEKGIVVLLGLLN